RPSPAPCPAAIARRERRGTPPRTPRTRPRISPASWSLPGGGSLNALSHNRSAGGGATCASEPARRDGWALRSFGSLRTLPFQRSPDVGDGVAPGLDRGVAGPRAGGEADPPVVPRAGDHAVLDEPARQRRPHVRAQVIDRVELAGVAEHRHLLPVHADDRA